MYKINLSQFILGNEIIKLINGLGVHTRKDVMEIWTENNSN